MTDTRTKLHDVELRCAKCKHEKLETVSSYYMARYYCDCGGTLQIVVEHDHVLTHAEATARGYNNKQRRAKDYISLQIEEALAACGRDRVMQRTQGSPSVAIRWDVNGKVTSQEGTERFLVRDGATLDEAGKEAATAFAARIREQAKELAAWADRIEGHLNNWSTL